MPPRFPRSCAAFRVSLGVFFMSLTLPLAVGVVKQKVKVCDAGCTRSAKIAPEKGPDPGQPAALQPVEFGVTADAGLAERLQAGRNRVAKWRARERAALA